MIRIEPEIRDVLPKRIRVFGKRDPLGEFVYLSDDTQGPAGYYFVSGLRAILPNTLRLIADKLDDLNQSVVGAKIVIG